MAKHGGKREGAGRKPGSPNKATAETRKRLQELAVEHTDEDIKALVQIARNGTSESARVSAATAILDRAYGRPQQNMELTGRDSGPIQMEDTGGFYDLGKRLLFIINKAREQRQQMHEEGCSQS